MNMWFLVRLVASLKALAVKKKQIKSTNNIYLRTPNSLFFVLFVFTTINHPSTSATNTRILFMIGLKYVAIRYHKHLFQIKLAMELFHSAHDDLLLFAARHTSQQPFRHEKCNNKNWMRECACTELYTANYVQCTVCCAASAVVSVLNQITISFDHHHQQ